MIDYTHRPKNIDATEIGNLVNDAYIYVAALLRCFQVKSAALTLTAGDGDYDLVTDLGLTDFVTLRVLQYTAASGANTLNTLAPTTPDEIIALRTANPDATSPAVAYSIQGWSTLLLHPLPSTGDTLRVTYGAKPTLMVLDASTPSVLPENLHHLIVQRAASIAMEVMDDRRSLLLKQEFQAELGKARLWLNQNQGSRGFAPAASAMPIVYPGDDYFRVPV